MNTTVNLSLKKPGGTDPIDVSDLNENSDILDGFAGTVLSSVSALQTAVSGKASAADLAAEVTAREAADSTLTAALCVQIDRGAKNLLPLTAETTVINGVTFTVDRAAGTVTVSADGTQTTNTFFYLVRNDEDFRAKICGQNVTLSGCPSGGSGSTYRLRCWHYDGSSIASDLGDGASFVFTNASENYDVSIQIFAGAVCDNVVFKPMICAAADYEISPAFRPYTPTNRELYEMILALEANA